MAIADRHYMRDSDSGRLGTAPVWLVILILNIVVFFAEYARGRESYYYYRFLEYGALSLDGVKHWYLWQFLTFQFLHDGLPHLVLNSVVLWSFGRHVEAALGRRAFLTLYLLSGFAGGAAQVALGLVSEKYAGPMVGASAGICGLVAAFALLHPNSIIYLLFVVPFRAIYFLPLVIALSLLLLVLPGSKDHIAHGAHLGGILAGIAWIRWSGALQQRLERWRPFRARQRKRELVKAASVRATRWPLARPQNPDELPEEEFISREVDPILDKISAHGIQSLTERERRILEAARNKMAKR
jgi:membrane associated rhomboid family serine protease